MLVLLAGDDEATGGHCGRALRDLLGEPAAPAAWVDVAGLVGAGPAAHEGDPFARARDVLGAAVDALEAAGVRRHVIGISSALGARGAELAFFLKRRDAQRCFLLRPADRTGWAREAAEVLRRAESPALLRTWEPAAPRVETPRLVLTFATREQTAGYYRAIAGTDIFEMLVWEGPRAESELHDWSLKIRRQHALGAQHPAGFAVIERSSGRQIGAVGGMPAARNPGRWTIGYSLAPAFHGRGYGTESVGALVDYLFAARVAQRVDAEVYTINPASRRLLEKLGFALEGTLPQGQAKGATRRDLWIFGITRGDWERRAAH